MRLFLFFLCALCSCTGFPKSRPSEKSQIAYEVRMATAEKLKSKMDLIPFGFGARMMNQITLLKLTFLYRHPIDIEGGRKMLIQAANELLREINSNERIRPYLDRYPFELNNVEIVIVMQKADGSNVDAGELALMEIRDGVLQYKFDESNTSVFRVVEETVEEAMQKL